jgi:hypothetical protein
MKHGRYIFTLVGLLCLLSISLAQEPSCNPPNLPLQLGQLASVHPIDSCRCTGAPKGAAGSQIRVANDHQNLIKNNFTRPTNNAKRISIGEMALLQERVNTFSMEELPRGDRFTLPSPAQRTLLTNISLGPNKTFSEGDVITIAGFVLGARHSNLEDGESVNCEQSGCASNDIHIELAAHPRDFTITKAKQMNKEGVDAEISPRHRPLEWDTFDSSSYRDFFKTHPVAFTGQLFYDASHSPGGGPDRVSVWEVHPVYAIWVCRKTTPQACQLDQLNNESVWLPFHRLKSFLHLPTVQVTEACQDNP